VLDDVSPQLNIEHRKVVSDRVGTSPAPLDEAARLGQERRERIDKVALTLSEPCRFSDLGHRAIVASKTCPVCGRNCAHAHHLKFAQPNAGPQGL
jgi:hypothetical protein